METPKVEPHWQIADVIVRELNHHRAGSAGWEIERETVRQILAKAYAARPEPQTAPARIAELEKALAEETYMCLQLRQQIEQMMPEAQMRVVNFQRAETQIQPSRTTAYCVRCGEVKPVPENYPSALLICSDCAAKDKPQHTGDNRMVSNTNDSPMPGTKEWAGSQQAASREPESTVLRRAAEELWRLARLADDDRLWPGWIKRPDKEAWIAAKIAQWTKGE